MTERPPSATDRTEPKPRGAAATPPILSVEGLGTSPGLRALVEAAHARTPLGANLAERAGHIERHRDAGDLFGAGAGAERVATVGDLVVHHEEGRVLEELTAEREEDLQDLVTPPGAAEHLGRALGSERAVDSRRSRRIGGPRGRHAVGRGRVWHPRLA